MKELTFAEWWSFTTHQTLNSETPNEFIHSAVSDWPKYCSSGIAFITYGTDSFKPTILNTS